MHLLDVTMDEAPASEPDIADSGDLHDVLGTLYREEYARMVRFAAARLGDDESAQDAVNDTFVTALRRADDLRDRRSLEAWVWSILINNTRMERRRRRWFTGGPPDLSRAEAPEEPVIDRDLREVVRRLPTRQRTVLFLRYYGDLPNTTIAEVLGISTGTVGATIHRAQETLRQILQERTG